MPKLLWEPGKSPYSEWLKTLTPEEKEQHLIERKQKKSMRKAFEEVIESQKEAWLAKINNGFEAALNKAIENGDAQSIAIIHDRLIGKPKDNVDITSGGDKVQAPTIIFKTTELSEWNDDTNKPT